MTATIVNSLFVDNATMNRGGGFAVAGNSYGSPDVTVANCTFAENTAGSYGGAISVTNTATIPAVDVYNTIAWGNGPDQIGVDGVVTLDVQYSCIQGGHEGEGNIDEDPVFVDGHHLSSGSPCIDAGNNDLVPDGVETDLDGNPRFVDGDGDGEATVDMGCYEFQPAASCPADVNGDGVVDVIDMIAVLAVWGQTGDPGWIPEDINDDGIIDVQDLLVVLGAWGPCG